MNAIAAREAARWYYRLFTISSRMILSVMRHATDHATERALERYGILAVADDWARAVLDIADAVDGTKPSALLVRRDGNMEKWIVRLRGVAVMAIYDPHAAVFVTLLPG